MAQRPEAITRVSGCVTTASALEATATLVAAWLRAEADSRPVLGSAQALVDYLRAQHAHAMDEEVRAVFLTSRHRLLGDERFALGTVDQAPIWPRAILRRCLELNAAAVILVHNHPSGDHFPSPADKEATVRFMNTARALDIELHDHLVISATGYSSLKSLGFI